MHQVVAGDRHRLPGHRQAGLARPRSAASSFVDLVREAGLPEPWCQTFLPESNELAEALATDPRIAFLSFIGSARVGWYLHSKLAARHALGAGAWRRRAGDRRPQRRSRPGRPALGRRAATTTPGRSACRCSASSCTPTSRPLPRALRRGGGGAAGRRPARPGHGGRPADPAEGGGPRDVLDRGGEAGAARGSRLAADRLSETTVRRPILVEPPADAQVSREEVFGPVTCVYGFTDLDEAIGRPTVCRSRSSPRSSRRDLAAALRAAERLDASAVMVNDHTAFRTDWMPFAGRRIRLRHRRHPVDDARMPRRRW